MENLMSTEVAQDITIIHFNFDEISLEQREYLKNQLHEVLRQGNEKFVIDLSKVGFFSSLVTAAVVFFTKEVRSAGGEVKLSGLSSEALSLFKITRLDSIFELYETKHDAIESFKHTG